MKTVKAKAVLVLKCQLPSCGKIFRSGHYRKYCKPACRKKASAIKGQMRYQLMRDAYLRSRGEIK